MSVIPRVFVVSGPSGAGKTTLIGRLRRDYPKIPMSVSWTTRQPREGEIDGIDYFFVSEAVFQARAGSSGGFLESAKVHETSYGTPRDAVETALASGTGIILDIDVQGRKQLCEAMSEVMPFPVVSIFVSPPDMEVLKQRLADRGVTTKMDIRLANAQGEIEAGKAYEHQVVNDDPDAAYAAFKSIIESYLV